MKSPPLILVAALLAVTLTGCSTVRRMGIDMLSRPTLAKTKNLHGVVLEELTATLRTEHGNALRSVPLHGMRVGTVDLGGDRRAVLFRDKADNVPKLMICDPLVVRHCADLGAFDQINIEVGRIHPEPVSVFLADGSVYAAPFWIEVYKVHVPARSR